MGELPYNGDWTGHSYMNFAQACFSRRCLGLSDYVKVTADGYNQ